MNQEMEQTFLETIRNWDSIVHADKDVPPLFFKSRGIPRIAGPTPTNAGIIGDLFTTEISSFFEFTRRSPFKEYQEGFYEYLERTDKAKWKQYVLTVINGVDIWKNDLAKIERFLNALIAWREALESEEKNLEQNDLHTLEHMIIISGFDVFQDHRLLDLLQGALTSREIEHLTNDVRSFIDKVKREEGRLSQLISIITLHLNRIKEDYPFLVSSTLSGELAA